MSDETRAALHEAFAAHLLATPTPTDPDPVTLAELHAAARDHLDDVDPGYHDRISIELAPGITLALEPHQRFVIPGLQAEYNELLEARAAGDLTAEQAARVNELGQEIATATKARRILEGRSLNTGVDAVAAAATPAPEA